MELFKFAAESWWNLFVTMLILSTLGGFAVAIVAGIAEFLAALIKKREK